MTSGLNLLRPRRHRNIRYGSFFSDNMMEQEEEVMEEESEIMKRGDAAEPAEMVSAGGSSKIVGVDRGWLQLGISDGGRRHYKDDRSASSSRSSTRPELDLIGGGSAAAACKLPLVGFPTSAPPPWLPGVAGCHHRWEHQRASSSARPSPSSSAWGRPPPPATPSLASYGEIRVVSLPRRTQTPGLWLVLQAAPEQKKEPFLPQIPKSYLRIKDGRMTIRLLMKYLANKLVLEDESEVEISCRGQKLSPSMTLISIRDNIWCSSPEAVAEQQQQSDSSTTNKYVMNLLYSRSSRSNGS
ncbi:protein LAX PANICLE 2-like [Zingiber officinale]|uniref:protein LAX PANICLE 2-like n=1 Tax=Zingiber officinale TaxID=94328 RepID=UPI001C4DD4E7|nr:protein LAX PANICLE 2-like [Zingiber officinale]